MLINCLVHAYQLLPKKDFLLYERELQLPFLPPLGFQICFNVGKLLLDDPPVWLHNEGQLLLRGRFDFVVGAGQKKLEERAEVLWRDGWILQNTTRHVLEEAKHRKYYGT